MDKHEVVGNSFSAMLPPKRCDWALQTAADLALKSGPSNDVDTSSTSLVVASDALISVLSEYLETSLR